MVALGWLSRHAADVPAGNDWLCDAERRVQHGLRLRRRRADWRLGRWTAKCAVGAWLGIEPERIAALRAQDGGPEAWLDGSRLPVSLSISHRAGRALAAVGPAPANVGCDLELIEPRSGAFVREWLAPAEQRLVADHPLDGHTVLANAIWSAKEAATKVLREGLRLNVRNALVSLDGGEDGADDDHFGWRAVRVDWRDGPSAAGWWRVEEPFVIVVLSDLPLGVPRSLRPATPAPLLRPATPVPLLRPATPVPLLRTLSPVPVLRTLGPSPALPALSPPPERQLLARTP
jgi:4'-phosphopantetheinyl transferase